MALDTTLYAAKSAIRDVLFETLNSGLSEGDPEWVDVFYGWQNASSTNRMVVVGNSQTLYATGERTMGAIGSLRKYGLTYRVDIDCAASFSSYDQEGAERECYQLLDRVLTPLVRGDETGGSVLLPRLAGISDVVPSTDTMVVRSDMTDQSPEPRYNVVRFQLDINLRRD